MLGNLPILLFGVVSIVAGGVGFTLPETKETVMPDNIDDVENDCDRTTCGHPSPPTLSDFKKSGRTFQELDQSSEENINT